MKFSPITLKAQTRQLIPLLQSYAKGLVGVSSDGEIWRREHNHQSRAAIARLGKKQDSILR